MVRRIYIILLVALGAMASCLYVSAGNKDNSKNFNKMVAKEVKNYQKQNWSPLPGQAPLETQVETIMRTQAQTDDDGQPANLVAVGIGKGTSLNSTQMAATELARQALATQIEANVSSMVEMWTANEQLSPTEAKTVSRLFGVSRLWVNKTLYKVNTIATLYRKTDSGGYEVMVTMSYPTDKVRSAAQQSLLEQLEGDEPLKQRLDSLINNPD